jgi:hypothetical protein
MTTNQSGVNEGRVVEPNDSIELKHQFQLIQVEIEINPEDIRLKNEQCFATPQRFDPLIDPSHINHNSEL